MEQGYTRGRPMPPGKPSLPAIWFSRFLLLLLVLAPLALIAAGAAGLYFLVLPRTERSAPAEIESPSAARSTPGRPPAEKPAGPPATPVSPESKRVEF